MALKVRTSGIYVIENALTGDKYVGSSESVVRRFYEHRSKLRHQKHHSKRLQRSWNKYGEGLFRFRMVEACDAGLLYEREQWWINHLKPRFNCVQSAYPWRRTWTTEQRARLATSMREMVRRTPPYVRSAEHRRRVGERSRGNAYTLGRKQSPEHVARKVAAFKRTIASTDLRARMVEAARRREARKRLPV